MEHAVDTRAVAIYGEAVLRKNAAVVSRIDDTVRDLVQAMKATMYAEEGAGLAAPQIHTSLRVALVDITAGEEEPYVLINPEITWQSEETQEDEEGCLSIPEIRLPVERALRVCVRAMDIHGRVYTIDNAEGLLARALQHEIDHLNGVLFVDRAAPIQRQMVAGKLKKLAKSAKK
jgi:peptide deformylase